jgi:hypothetical protein
MKRCPNAAFGSSSIRRIEFFSVRGIQDSSDRMTLLIMFLKKTLNIVYQEKRANAI